MRRDRIRGQAAADVEFHNGKTFGAEDLIYSIRLMAKPANFASVPFVAGINLND
jgi:ABC-type transport system substrate-binding protein